MNKQAIARKLKKLPGKYRVRTLPGWGCWVWEYKQRGDKSGFGWHSVCLIEEASRYFGI